jgi:hypothetical protein
MKSRRYLAGREIEIGLSDGCVLGCVRAADDVRGRSANSDEWYSRPSGVVIVMSWQPARDISRAFLSAASAVFRR